MNPEISIIIPVYKAEKYLRRCLDSVLSQTLSNWECILVDDGSPDQSGAICDEYAAKDSRFRVIHKPNGGVSSARNEGLDTAKGEFICFIDSDDWVGPKYLEHLHFLESDLVISGLFNVNEKGKIIKTKEFKNALFELSKIGLNEFERTVFSSKGPYCKRYRRTIIESNNIRFEEGIHASEDFLFVLSYISKCKTIQTSQMIDYYYQHNYGSLVSCVWSFDDELKLNYLFKKVIVSLSTVFPESILRLLEKYRCTLLYRAINSIYLMERKDVRLAKLKELKTIDFGYGVSFNKLYFEHSWKFGFLHWLYRVNLFSIYDFVKTHIK